MPITHFLRKLWRGRIVVCQRHGEGLNRITDAAGQGKDGLRPSHRVLVLRHHGPGAGAFLRYFVFSGSLPNAYSPVRIYPSALLSFGTSDIHILDIRRLVGHVNTRRSVSYLTFTIDESF